MYESLRRATNAGRNPNDIELLQPYGYRQRPSSIRSSNDFTIDGQRSQPFVKLLHSAKTTEQLSDDRGHLLPQEHSSHHVRLSKPRFLPSGWRTGALISLIGAVFVFVFNLSITIWVWANPSFQANGAIGTMYRGNCAVVRNMNVRIHLLVNVLSTMLLCGSNYVMQVLAAPNREEVDRAHAQRRWLHIGVPNFRNLRYIRRNRVVIYIFLFLSSVPLHLLFNSVVFTQLQANEYFVLPTMEDWIQGREYNFDNFDNFTDIESLRNKTWIQDFEPYRIEIDDTVKLSNGTTVPMYRNMTAAECFTKYGSHYISDVGNAYLVQAQPTVWRNPDKWELHRLELGGFEWAQTTNDSSSKDERDPSYQRVDFNATLPFPSSPRRYPSNVWRCQSHTSTGCDPGDESEIPRDRSQWKPYGSDLSYCLVEQVDEFCELQFSFTIAILVIIANLVKATCMAITLWKCGGHAAFVTIGDAIASFLDNPDPSTSGRCLQTRRHVELWWSWNQWAMDNPHMAMKRDRRKFRSRRRTWAMAPSERRWVATYWSYSALFVAGIPLTVLALKGMPRDLKRLWETGFGVIQGNNLLNFDTSLMGGVLLANTPQALLSYMYLAFNALYTTMFISSEWASYSVQRKPLRVTSPVGQQRHTYWLGVPYRYAIPVTLVSGLFHWLASQSLFKVQISVTDMYTRRVKDQISTCGYSPVPIILTMVVATVIAGTGIAISRIRFPSGMPLAASNSAAISAACHPPKEDSDASVLPVQWGVVSHEYNAQFSRDEHVGHCCFTSFPVEPPIEGHLYQ